MNPGALAGFTVGMTADHRKDELRGMLEHRGARFIAAPALRLVPPEVPRGAGLDALKGVGGVRAPRT